MSDEFDYAAMLRDAGDLLHKARSSGDFAGSIFLAAAQLVAATGNRAEIEQTLQDFTHEVWKVAGNTPDAIADADAFLARIRSAEGGLDV